MTSPHPTYWSAGDIAAYTGLSTQRIYQLWHSAAMPAPTFYRRYGSVWRADRIKAWWQSRPQARGRQAMRSEPRS